MTDVTRLKSFVERIERLEEEQRAIGGDKKDIYTEAKSAGVNPKALRKIIAKRKAKPDPEVEAAMDAYEVALGMAATMVSNGATSLRKAAAETGFSKSAIQREVSHQRENAISGTVEEDDLAIPKFLDRRVPA